MPKIDIDGEVFGFLEGMAQGFDTPNKVLRRLLNLDKALPPTLGVQNALAAALRNEAAQPTMTTLGALGSLGTGDYVIEHKVPPGLFEFTAKRQRKTKLSELVRVGRIAEHEQLTFRDYRRKVHRNIVATVEGDLIRFNNELLSMSEAARRVMEAQRNFENKSYRGPDFWVVAGGKSIRALWDELLAETTLGSVTREMQADDGVE